MALSGFICHDDYLKKTERLSNEELGRVFRALMKYHANKEEPDFDGMESMAFDFIRVDIDRADNEHQRKCETNREIRLQAIENERQRSSTNVNERDHTKTKTRQEKEKEKENDKESTKETAQRFTPPTVDEIRQYCTERGNGIDPEYFFTYYENRDWKLSNGKKMKDWKLAIVTWEKNGFNKTRSAPVKTVPAQNYGQRPYEDEDEAARRRMFAGVV